MFWGPLESRESAQRVAGQLKVQKEERKKLYGEQSRVRQQQRKKGPDAAVYAAISVLHYQYYLFVGSTVWLPPRWVTKILLVPFN